MLLVTSEALDALKQENIQARNLDGDRVNS